jgi:hypothetical protein
MAIVQPLLQVSPKSDDLTIESASQIFSVAFGGLRSRPTLPGTTRTGAVQVKTEGPLSFYDRRTHSIFC